MQAKVVSIQGLMSRLYAFTAVSGRKYLCVELLRSCIDNLPYLR